MFVSLYSHIQSCSDLSHFLPFFQKNFEFHFHLLFSCLRFYLLRFFSKQSNILLPFLHSVCRHMSFSQRPICSLQNVSRCGSLFLSIIFATSSFHHPAFLIFFSTLPQTYKCSALLTTTSLNFPYICSNLNSISNSSSLITKSRIYILPLWLIYI